MCNEISGLAATLTSIGYYTMGRYNLLDVQGCVDWLSGKIVQQHSKNRTKTKSQLLRQEGQEVCFVINSYQ